MKTSVNLGKSIGTIAFAAALTGSAFALTYQVTAIPTLTGGTYSDAYALNNHGQVVGVADITGGFQRGYMYDGSMYTISPGTGGQRSWAYDINDNKQITGYRQRYFAGTNSMMKQGFLWNYNSNIVYNIGNFAASDYYESMTFCIAPDGTVGGAASGRVGSPSFSAMICTIANGFTYLGTVGNGSTDCITYGIAANNQACGYGEDANGNTRSFRYSNGTFFNIGGYQPTLGVIMDTYAEDINSAGTIVGSYRVDSDTFRATRRLAGLPFGDMGKLNGVGGSDNDSSGLAGINTAGDMVGYSEVGNANYRAVLIPAGSNTMIDLNTLLPAGSGWVLEFARDINDKGWICGQGKLNGQKRGFLIKPMANISGTVTLQDYLPDELNHWVTFEIRDAATKQVLDVKVQALGAGGSYSINTTAVGPNKEIHVKYGHWLGQTIPANLSTNVINKNFSLVNGDCDGDNEVNLVDMAKLAAAFGKAYGEPGYDWNADLDGDLEVTLVDLGILSGRFGQVGDE